MIGRRGFITGLVSLVAAPAIMRAGSLMPVKVMLPNAFTLEQLDKAWLALAEKSVNPPIIGHYGPEYAGTLRTGGPCLWVPSAAWLECHGRFDHLAEYIAAHEQAR